MIDGKFDGDSSACWRRSFDDTLWIVPNFFTVTKCNPDNLGQWKDEGGRYEVTSARQWRRMMTSNHATVLPIPNPTQQTAGMIVNPLLSTLDVKMSRREFGGSLFNPELSLFSSRFV